MVEVFFNFIPLRFPLLRVGDLLDFDVGLSNILKSTGATDAFCGLDFVTGDHPDFDAGAFEGFNGLLEVLLKFVLNAGDA